MGADKSVERRNTNEIQCQVKKSELKTPRYGRQRGKRRWTPTQVVAQDNRVSYNSLKTHLVRKWWDTGNQWAVGPENDTIRSMYDRKWSTTNLLRA